MRLLIIVSENLARKVNPHLAVVDCQVSHREDVNLENILNLFCTNTKINQPSCPCPQSLRSRILSVFHLRPSSV